MEPLLLRQATDNYRSYRNEFIAWMRRKYGACPEEAKDAFQDAICVFYEQGASGVLGGLSGSLKTYLFAIGRNKLLTRLRSRTIHGNHSAAYAIHMERDGPASAQQNMERQEDLEKLREELGRLAPDDRRILELFYVERMDMVSIAEAMGYKNANVAKKKKCIALKRLMEKARKGFMTMMP
jgi:RNA polymerase sigma factor (sigma-70 family)